jgi:hypothetical protein
LIAPPIILGGIISGLYTATEAGIVGCVYGLFVGLFIYRDLKVSDLKPLLAEAGGRPLTTQAAERLIKNFGKGDSVFIVTGAGYPPTLPKGESDGPPGAAVMGRALYWGLEAVPVYLCEERHAAPVFASSEAADIMIKNYEDAREGRLGGVLETAPNDPAAVEGWVKEMFDTYQPEAIIFTERLGPNEMGIIHGATGIAKESWTTVDLAPLVYGAQQRGVFSIGIGDHGNELGFGRIHGAVKEIMPYGKKCQCPCGAGMATVVKTDVLIPAFISNWGCYGVEAMLAFLLRKPDLMHTPEQERRIVMACLEAGGLEAMWCSKAFFVDGARGECGMAAVDLLGEMVRLNLAEPRVGVTH